MSNDERDLLREGYAYHGVHPTVTGASAAGSNHLVAEAFADGI